MATNNDTANQMRAFLARELGGRQRSVGAHPRYANSARAREMAAIRSAAIRDMEEIRKDSRLTDKGKQQAIARGWKTSNARISKLAKAERDEQIRRYNSIEQQLFGASSVSGADAEAARNATAFADGISSPQAALRALDTAARNGDNTLSRAVAYRAWQNGWHNVVDEYTGDNASIRDRLQELQDLQTHLNSTTVWSAEVSKPQELRQISDRDIDRYADEDPQATTEYLLNNRFTNGMSQQQVTETRERAVAEALGGE